MKLLVDECCSPAIVAVLRQDGHDVRYVPEDISGITDKNILKQGFEEQRIIVTEDRDFGELIFLNRLPSYGVVLIRISHAVPRDQRLRRIHDLFSDHAEQLSHTMVTLTVNAIRTRPLPVLPDPPGESTD